jgi:putative flippase GtrA
MKKTDIIFAIIGGFFVAWLATDFLDKKYALFLYIFFPIFSIFCLVLANWLAKWKPFIFEAGKFVLAGGVADIIDIRAFQLIILFVPASLVVKALSFLIAVAIKYFANKLWVFQKTEKNNIHKEAGQFLIITLGGLALNVASFYCATKFINIELSIIFSAIVASVWNFCGYKFFVFKKII